MNSTTTARRSFLRSPVAISIALVLVLIAVLILTRPPTYARGSVADPENPEPRGSMAAAEILRDQGVEINVVRSTSSALASTSEALVITRPAALSEEQLAALAGQARDTILVQVQGAVHGFIEDLDVEQGPRGVIESGCADPRAGAGSIRTSSALFSAPGAETCFPGEGAGALLSVPHADGFRVTVFPYDVALNSNLTEESNAALTLRTFGEYSSLTWLIASPNDPYPGQSQETNLELSWFYTAVVVLFLAFAWWRGPRFGRLSVEPLPVVVHASETTVGRGRLYQAAKDLAHAATSLRLAALGRIAPRLGLSPTATKEEVLAAITKVSLMPESTIHELLYGPPPTSGRSLHALALSLDALVDEVESR